MDESGHTSYRLQLRTLRRSDYDDIKEIMRHVYPSTMGGEWDFEEFSAQITRFPEGQICIEDDGKVVAAALSLIIDYGKFGDAHTYDQVVGEGYIENHDPEGDYLYGIDVFVHPDYRGLRLGRRLYDARKELCENANLKGILIGGRIPNYQDNAGEVSPHDYIQMVQARELHDPVLTFQLSNGFHFRKVIRGYWPEDRHSMGYGVLLEWNNIYYEETGRRISQMRSYIRFGAVQWQMRLFRSLDDMMQQVEFFVDTLADYNADIILFPELFNAPLMWKFNQEDPAEAMRSLAEYTDEIRQRFLEMAVEYNVNIVAGSMPEYHESKLFNVSFLCRRDGTWDKQYKLHITPDESRFWGLQGGFGLREFETDVGTVGILVCYDVEFPELARYLADRGINILLVPFWTDTKNGYLRVRRCAQARAIENECYVAISGSVGNIPKVENMDIQYSQAAVFTPADFAFPHDAIAAEANPNTEMVLVADLDVELLKELRQQGSVRNLRSRRRDLYRLDWLGKRNSTEEV
ncbi:MAG: GNAT family N-acetyltransferase [Synergistales bacterium]|nr:GNAT family N-acetyltransferase [Synergistales bacterium]